MRPYLPLLGFLLILGSACGGDDDGGTDAGRDTGTTDSGVDAARDTGGTDTGTDSGGSDAGEDAGPLPRECTVDDDCQLINDCCFCQAASADFVPLACPEDCLQPSCQAAGIEDPMVECLAGSCTLTNLDCDESTVVCDAPAPVCAPGELPHITGGCYSGLCVPVETCARVPSCDSCPDSHACVRSEAFMLSFQCVPVDPSCTDGPTCDCMGDEACGGDPFMCVTPGSGDHDLSCVCPAC